MDATFLAVSRLWEQNYSQNEIAHHLKISQQKVRKILLTIGAISTEESELYTDGHTLEQIVEITGKSPATVSSRLPYTKGAYNAEYPTINALRIRKSRQKESIND